MNTALDNIVEKVIFNNVVCFNLKNEDALSSCPLPSCMMSSVLKSTPVRWCLSKSIFEDVLSINSNKGRCPVGFFPPSCMVRVYSVYPSFEK